MMSKILALTFIATFYSANSELIKRDGESIACSGCAEVNPSNDCIKRSYICYTKRTQYCYQRMVSKHGVILFVDRGCTTNCKPVQDNGVYRNVTQCCPTWLCNTHNYWEHE